MEEINIKDFLSYLKHYILAFVLVIALAVGGILTYDMVFKKPVYQAQTTIVIAKSDSAATSASALSDVNASQKLATTYGEIAKSELVLNKVIENLGLSASVKEIGKNLTVKPVEDTSILSVTVRNLDPDLAARIANEIANVFSEEVSQIYKLDNVSQLSVAKVPTTPSNNTITRDVILAVVVAIAAVGGFAFLRFYLDDTVKHTDDVERIYGLATAGRISKNDMKSKRSGSDTELVLEKYPKAIVSENIKSLRTNLQFTAIDKNLKTILVTSTNAGEGKSFVSANLAISFAQAEKKVLLVDCDLRKGRVHRLFDIPNTNGLSNLLTDKLENISHYIHNTSVQNLDIITCGTYPPNPSELLSSKKNKKLLSELKHRYNIIIFDGAPIGGLADSVILSSMMDETLIVVKDGSTSRADLSAAKLELEKVGAKIAGVVFNMVNRTSSKYYYYYYGEDDTKKSVKRK